MYFTGHIVKAHAGYDFEIKIKTIINIVSLSWYNDFSEILFYAICVQTICSRVQEIILGCPKTVVKKS